MLLPLPPPPGPTARSAACSSACFSSVARSRAPSARSGSSSSPAAAPPGAACCAAPVGCEAAAVPAPSCSRSSAAEATLPRSALAQPGGRCPLHAAATRAQHTVQAWQAGHSPSAVSGAAASWVAAEVALNACLPYGWAKGFQVGGQCLARLCLPLLNLLGSLVPWSRAAAQLVPCRCAPPHPLSPAAAHLGPRHLLCTTCAGQWESFHSKPLLLGAAQTRRKPGTCGGSGQPL